MQRYDSIYNAYLRVLKQELVCAMGCTEPIAIAYCAAKARSLLGNLPTRVEIQASGNMIKNVKSVVVPNTGGQRGIPAAAAIGILGGDEKADLLVIANVTPEIREKMPDYLERTRITVSALESSHLLDVILTAYYGEEYVRIRVADEHTNIVLIEKNHQILFEKEVAEVHEESDDMADHLLLTVAGICEFASICDLDDVKDVLDRQISCNTAISEEGLRGAYGASIGQVLLKNDPNNIRTIAKARAAAGSDARMSGCEMPVIINSGSGNQGLTASLPVVAYAKDRGVDEDTMYRALLVSNLVTIHAKTSIGRLSAYCGAVSAGAGAGAGIAFLCGGDCKTISHTIVNALAITSGIVCDGAKASCAAKIAVSVEAGIMGYEMYRDGHQFYAGDGLVVKGVEESIARFGELGRVAMEETNKEICRMMAEGC